MVGVVLLERPQQRPSAEIASAHGSMAHGPKRGKWISFQLAIIQHQFKTSRAWILLLFFSEWIHGEMYMKNHVKMCGFPIGVGCLEHISEQNVSEM